MVLRKIVSVAAAIVSVLLAGAHHTGTIQGPLLFRIEPCLP